MHDSGDYPIAEIAAIFKVSRPTIYCALQRTTPGSANLPADTRPGLPSLDKYDQLRDALGRYVATAFCYGT